MQLTPQQIIHIKKQALHEARMHDVFMLLDNHQAANAFGLHDVEFAFAAGVRYSVQPEVERAFDELKAFTDLHKGEYVFGTMGYDLKNGIERLSSAHPDRIGFPVMFFFVPEQLVIIGREGHVITGNDIVSSLQQGTSADHHPGIPSIPVLHKVSREKYLDDVRKIRAHIVEGDVYELNYCVEFYAEDVQADPFSVYRKLSESSPVPFGGMVRIGDRFLMSASPERFIRLKGGKLYSQPIKGTAPRGADSKEDDLKKSRLIGSEKERAENLMIVDLVRNDLSRSAETGTVKVEELFGIYTFPYVHQMISTVSAVKHKDVHPVDAIRNAFPMGSMTGAPKIKAMELIEQYEITKRGLYSGAFGYFSPDGDFDFNVVIRSIQYNKADGYLSFETGGAITYDSVPEEEYEECLLKAGFMMKLLTGKD